MPDYEAKRDRYEKVKITTIVPVVILAVTISVVITYNRVVITIGNKAPFRRKCSISINKSSLEASVITL